MNKPFYKSRNLHLNSTKMKFNQFFSFSVRIILITLFLISLAPPAQTVSAQSGDSDWGSIVNLSNSGATENPVLIKGNTGKLHALWQDEYARFVYRFFDNGWSPSYNLDLPFYGYGFKSIVDQTGWIYFFWIDETNNNLYYSGVNEDSFANDTNWLGSILLASGVVAFDVTVDVNNDLHLVYARARESSEFPAGIYYSKTRRSISSWSTSKELYTSKYYRSMIPPAGITGPEVVFNLDLMHVNVTTIDHDGEIQVFAGWENPAIKRLYYAQSPDDGTNWAEPIEIVSPSDELINITPQKLNTISTPSKIMQLWEISEPGGNCSLFYRTSENKGQQWSVQQSLDDVFGNCPETLSWIATENDQILFISGKQNVVSLIAWDGVEWSLPQSQEGLNKLINPDTLDLISFESYNIVLSGDNLFIIGRDNTSSKDVWITQKTLGDINNWYGAGITWSDINIQSVEGGKITNLQAFNGNKNLFYFAWMQPNPNSLNTSLLQLLTVSDGVSGGLITIRDNLEGIASQLTSATVLESDRLALMWRGGKYGHLYSSWVFLTQVTNPVGWSQPGQVGNTPIGHSPVITNMNGSELVAVYAVPYGDDMGVYWMLSENAGENWSESKKISNILKSEDCPQILDPQPLFDAENNIHILYICSTFEGGSGALSLYGTLTNDQGETWSTPVLINDRPTTWSRMFVDNNNTIHRLWKTNDEKTGLWHSYSHDFGTSWSSPENFALLEVKDGITNATIDRVGNINVLQTSNLIYGKSLVNFYHWTGEKWVNLPSLDLSAAGEGNITDLASGIDSNNNLQVGISIETIRNNPSNSEIILAHYPLSLSESVKEIPINEVEIIGQQETVQANTIEQTPTPTVEPSPTQTQPLNLLPSQGIPSGFSAIAGILISVIFITAAFIFIKRKK